MVDVVKRIVAGGLVAIIVAATTARPVCAVTCLRSTDHATAALPPAPASHCARMAHRPSSAPAPAPVRVAASAAHPCGDHARLATDDTRLTRVDTGVVLPALALTAAAIGLPPPASRLVAARHSGLPPPGPVRAPLVLRV